MKRIIFLVFLLLFIFSHFVFAAYGEISQEYTEIINNFISNFNNGNFHETAKLFHYPQDYNFMELQEDTSHVSRFLEYFNEEFGSIKSTKPSKSPVLIYSVQIAGGTLPYWEKHPKYYSQLYSKPALAKKVKGI